MARNVDNAMMLCKGSWTGDVFAWGPTTLIVPNSGSPWGPRYPTLVSHPNDGTLYLVYAEDQVADGSDRTVYLVRSLDRGLTWFPRVALSGVAADGPVPSVGPSGELVVLWVDYAQDRIVGRKSGDRGATFSPTFVVGERLDNFNCPPPGQYGGLFGGYYSNPTAPGALGFANFPAVAVDLSSGPHRGRIYATWVQQVQGSPGPISGGVGETEPNNDPTQADNVQIGQEFTGFVPSSDLGPTSPDYWTFDGQAGQTIALTGTTSWTPAPPPWEVAGGIQVFECGAAGQPTIELARSATGDGTYDVPPMVLTLPHSGRFVIVIRGAGPYSVTYRLQLRAYGVSPTSLARDSRDVVLAWSDDGGQTWTGPRLVGDGPPRFHDVLPAVHVDERGWVHVAWYDFREDDHCGARANVYWRMSADGGESFEPARRIGEYAGLWQGASFGGNRSPVGERLALTSEGTMLHLAWGDMRDRETGTEVWTELYTGRVELDGVVPTQVARFEASVGETGVELRWALRGVGELAALMLERATGSARWFEPLPLTLALPAEGEVQEVTDVTAEAGQEYRYRLAMVRLAGGVSYSEERGVRLPVRVAGLAWQRAEPNPFTRGVTLRLASGTRHAVEVAVHDVLGRRVRVLRRGELPAGETSVLWDGRREDGQQVASGVYVVRASDGVRTSTIRIVKME
jgi:hypothetical protein